jgi:hypothetical protein
MAALAERLDAVTAELRTVAESEQPDEGLSRITAATAAIVEELETAWITVSRDKRPPFGH